MRKSLIAATLGALGVLPLIAADRVGADPQRPGPPQNLRILRSGESIDSTPTSGQTTKRLVTSGTHAYFDSLASRPDCMAAYSLRDAAQVLLYTQSAKRPPAVTYDPVNDRDPRRQDAAKIVVPAANRSLPNQVRLPIPPWAGSSLMVTWDAWWGSEFRHENTGIGNYKAFQLASGDLGDRIWTEVRSRFQQAEGSPAVANVDVRFYGGQSTGPNVTDNVPLSPQVGTFAIQPETWTRYWAFFKPAGEWYEFSLWMADENRDAVRLIDRLQLKPNPNSSRGDWEKFWLEYNTSSNTIPEGRGPLVAYARNVVMLRNVPDPTNLLQRPQR